MNRMIVWLLLVSLFMVFNMSKSEEEEARNALVKFYSQLSHSNGAVDPSIGWNMSSDPCIGEWEGVFCDSKNVSVRKIVLDGFSLTGLLDAASLCTPQSLAVLSLQENNFMGDISEEIGNCKQLTHLLLSGNKLSGILPDSLSNLNNLKKFEISNNSFSGKLPNLARISGLVSFLADNNHFTGPIPSFDFSNFQLFNVSNNNFSGPVPNLKGRFGLDSISGNAELCGEPLSNVCPPSPSKKKNHSIEHILMYGGYILIGLLLVIFVAYKIVAKKKQTAEPQDNLDIVKPKGVSVDTCINQTSIVSNEHKLGASKTEYSMNSAESAMMSTSMVVLSSPVVKGMKFEDLLKAPAELLGRGKHGSLYRIVLEDGMPLVVKRIKDWAISGEDFKRRMQKIDETKHPGVLPALAFYSSKQEKLVVYRFEQNGSLLKLLYGSQNGVAFDWETRLSIAAKMAEALAFMHKELLDDGIAHGNIKSSNIMFNQNMDPCISEYGLMVLDNQNNSTLANGNNGHKTRDHAYSTFKVDLYGFGVILLELLTGKLVDNNGLDLAKWVHSVVSEEWTVEVFDKNLVKEGASEERMVNLLQVALKCTNASPEARPSMNEVASMISTIKEEEEGSIVTDVW